MWLTFGLRENTFFTVINVKPTFCYGLLHVNNNNLMRIESLVSFPW